MVKYRRVSPHLACACREPPRGWWPGSPAGSRAVLCAAWPARTGAANRVTQGPAAGLPVVLRSRR